MCRSTLYLLVMTASITLSDEAFARTRSECQATWSKAVRSYLTQNRRAAPDGTVPKDMDALDVAAKKWLQAFKSACDLESSGDRLGARVEATRLGIKILAKIDDRGCQRFLKYYMQVSNPGALCAAADSVDEASLRTRIQRNLPKRKRRRRNTANSS